MPHMKPLSSRAIAVMCVAHAAACVDAPDVPRDGSVRPDAGVSRGAAQPQDAAADARADATTVVDMDHDGHPAGAERDDNDPNVWANLPYAFRDADGDGHTIAQTGTICAGDSLPGPPDVLMLVLLRDHARDLTCDVRRRAAAVRGRRPRRRRRAARDHRVAARDRRARP